MRAHRPVLRWNESTAEGMALMRALASSDPRFPGGDHLAVGFITWPPLASLVRLPPTRPLLREMIERRVPGAYFYEVARLRHMDQLVIGEAQRGATQAVLLGAGYDTRPYRLREQAGRLRFFEVDQPSMSRRKRQMVRRILGRVPDDVRYVEVDFERDDADAAMRAAGLSADAMTVWVWSGVSMYLTVEAVSRVLRLVVAQSVPGSSLIFDYLYDAALKSPDAYYGARQSRRYVAHQGEPWRFGLARQEIPGFLAEHGFEMVSDLGPDELQRRYLTSGNGTPHGAPPGCLGICHARVAVATAPRQSGRETVDAL